MWLVTLIAAIAGGYVWYSVNAINGSSGFPLDDSWIHLTFARTLAQSAHFSYGALNPATSGSTSPLFTFLEAILFLVTSNEFAVAKLLSIAGLILAVFFLFRATSAARPTAAWLPLAAAALLVVSPRFLPASVWGMETTFAGAFIAAAAYFYEKHSWRALGITLGLSIWCRPDLALISLALVIDYFFLRRESVKPDWKQLLIPAIALGLAYVAFNFALSGSILPNTFGAKLAYYKAHRPGFWGAAGGFFSTQGQGLTIALALIGLLAAIFSIFKKRILTPVYPFLIAIGFVALYAWKLPYLYQDGRYLVPACVALVLAAVFGANALVEWLARGRFVSLAAILVLVAAFIQFVSLTGSDFVAHEASEEAYITNLQVATARWCATNLPKDAAIATHDIGAIGFYSGRKTVDMVGLVDPGIIPHIGDPVQTIRFLRKRGANYAALLDNWFEIVNENSVFAIRPPESEHMLIYPLHDSTRMSGETVLSIHKFLKQAIATQNTDGLDQAMAEATRLEPNNPMTYTLAGELLLELHRLPESQRMFETALSYFPNSDMARNDLHFITVMGKR
ncbi:MAG: hypothetical protein Q8922_02405 [Bacteroidota bacterium]|nr:hypothetical protein [Bacteroidota bacterium]MDP4232273.1 hypothetical protein [Bacteroidota bacterium]MDP4241412.1 hypothetical protein [Bacteroidota bacterium]MDP4286764.1 hypothetical protein [Bacteroidota bacterium]